MSRAPETVLRLAGRAASGRQHLAAGPILPPDAGRAGFYGLDMAGQLIFHPLPRRPSRLAQALHLFMRIFRRKR